MVDNQKVGIFCRTYDNDAKWLDIAIPTWQEYCTGYNGITVTGIDAECSSIKAICDKYGVQFVPDDESAAISNGYINQQYTKMRMDQFVPGCDYVINIDADTLCYGKNSPETWFTDGKPDYMFREWWDVGQAVCWQKPTWDAFGILPNYEFMGRMPLLYPVSTVKDCREYIEWFHKVSLLEYMQQATRFSEFNVLGHYAHEFDYDKFHWIEPKTDGIPYNPFTQYWSHGDMEQQLKDRKKT